MNTLPEHYRLLLGLDEAWEVESVELDLEGKRVQIRLSHRGGAIACPDCGAGYPRHDLAPERTWRHLDTMQFETLLQARVPRCQCSQCGVKTVAVPWAGKRSRFTLLFEAFAIQVLLASSSIQQAALLLRLDWGTVQSIMG